MTGADIYGDFACMSFPSGLNHSKSVCLFFCQDGLPPYGLISISFASINRNISITSGVPMEPSTEVGSARSYFGGRGFDTIRCSYGNGSLTSTTQPWCPHGIAYDQ